jgi:hypothetical protein
MRSVPRESVEKTIQESPRTFKSVAIRYFGRKEEVHYSNLNQVDWNNVQRASVEFLEKKWVNINGEVGSSTRTRVKGEAGSSTRTRVKKS